MSYYETITELRGSLPGPTSVILGGVHGDEVCGVEAIMRTVPTLTIKSGTVICLFGSPRAIEHNVRYVEANLNRMFVSEDMLSPTQRESYEYKRAQVIKPYLQKADALLDIHASFTPESRPFVICEPNAFSLAKTLPVDTVVSGFDATEPGGTDYYMNRLGKIGICLECGFINDKDSYKRAEQGLYSFLQTMGHLDTQEVAPSVPQEYMTMEYLYHTRTDQFRLAKRFADFEHVQRDAVIGIDGTTAMKAPYDGVILFARDAQNVGEEAFLYGRVTGS